MKTGPDTLRVLPLILLLGIIGIMATTEMPDQGDFEKIFDGKTLNGWEGNPNYWRVENGTLVGEITPDKLLKTNTFLIWKGGEPADFELKLECRISKEGNSGINYRSERLTEPPFALRGYQADIDGKNNYTGQNYEERGRTTLAYRGQKTIINDPANKALPLEAGIKNNAWTQLVVTESLGKKEDLLAKIKSEDWNQIHLIIKGNHLLHYVNGVLMSDVTDNDEVNRRMKGALGVQVHVGPPMKVEYREIWLKRL